MLSIKNLHALAGEKQVAEQVLDATNRRGRAIQIRVVAMPLAVAKQEPRGVILVMEDVSGDLGSTGPGDGGMARISGAS